MAKLKLVGECLYFSLWSIFTNSWMRLISLLLPFQSLSFSFFWFSELLGLQKKKRRWFWREPRCKVDAFDKISARVPSLQSLKPDAFALQGLIAKYPDCKLDVFVLQGLWNSMSLLRLTQIAWAVVVVVSNQQLISAVTFCHARDVYHGDLRAENLLLDQKGNLKVSDFDSVLSLIRFTEVSLDVWDGSH